MTNKITRIETLRGMTILLVVIGHVIGSTPDGGMKIDFPSPWRYVYLWIDYIQMPLFTAIAGWVYALKPVNHEFVNHFILKKIYRLIIPMITVSSLYFLVQYFTPGTNNKGDLADIWQIYIFPYSMYWYLPSLFLMFAFIAIIDVHGWANKLSAWTCCTLVAYLLLIAQESALLDKIPNVFCFKGTLCLFFYFLIGVGTQRFAPLLFSTLEKRVYIVMSFVGILMLQLEWFYPSIENSMYSSYFKPFGLTCIIALLLHQTYTNSFFTWLGKYAYSIYLFHGFGTSGGRIILKYTGVHVKIIIISCATSIALFCPVGVERIASRWKITRLLFLGKI